jgi:nucleoside-diphosphate-sugar epimerase
VPRIIAQARAGRLRIVGSGRNRVDLVHVENAADAHLLAELALGRLQFSSPTSQKPLIAADRCHLSDEIDHSAQSAAGRAFFITNGEPVMLWEWINGLLHALDIPPVTRHLSLGAATVIGGLCEALWRGLPLAGEPPMTRFVAKELATDHWFDISAARRDLGYSPRVSMAGGTAELVASLRVKAGNPAVALSRKA